MKILYIHQYFITPDSAGGTRSYYIALEMVKRGHSVTMLTSNSSSESSKLVVREEHAGIDVVSIHNKYDNNMSVARRVISFLKFMSLATFFSLREKDVDLVFATSTPLTVGVPALVSRFVKRTKYVFEVRDLWPEFPIQMGAIKSSVVIRLLRFFERKIYQHASLIVALSPGMKAPIDRLGFSEKTIMIPNMAKPKEFYPRPDSSDIRKKYGIKDKWVKIVYFGTLGRANNIEHLVKEAIYAEDNSLPVQFVIIGDGAMREPAENEVKSCSNGRVLFLGKQIMQDVSNIVNECDISITSFLDLPILETNSPNKFFDSLSAGKPCAVNIHGWIKELVEKHECGFYANPNIEGDLIRKSIELVNDKERYSLQSVNARKVAEVDYDRSQLTVSIVKALESIV